MLLADKKFGYLKVVKKVAPEIYLCRCDCGKTVECWRSQLWCKVKRHCGCRDYKCLNSRRTIIATHVRYYSSRSGKKGTRTTWEYNSWKNMKERCYGATRPEYPNYGGRGIRVCERWVLPNGEGFANFLADMGPRPQGMTLDRINPQGHYEPTNCRWATPKEQQWNQRRFIWKDSTPPPVEKVRAMEARVENFEELVEAY